MIISDLAERNIDLNRIAIGTAAVLSAAVLCGCSSADIPSETELSYNVISAEPEDVNAEQTPVIDEIGVEKPIETAFIDYPPEMVTKYGYDQLTDSQKSVYNKICETMKVCGSSAEIPNIDGSEAVCNRLLELIRTENIAYFHIADRKIADNGIANQSFNINFTYKYAPREINTMLRETQKAAEAVMDGITDDMDDYEKLKYFHDYLVVNCVSDASGRYSDTVYGALVDGKALCEGYSKAFSYLCNLAGIENMIITGNTNTAHMWNMVKTGGNWYHVDVTWDHPDKMITDKYPGTVLYQYFLVSDAEIKRTREINTALCTPPRATGSVMSYFYHEGMYSDSYEGALNIIENGCRDAAENNRQSFSIKLASSALYDEVVERLSNGTDISDTMESAGFTGRISFTNLYSEDRVLVFLLDYYDN